MQASSGLNIFWMVCALLAGFGLMGVVLLLGYLGVNQRIKYPLSPYTGLPVRRLLDASFYSLVRVYDYTHQLKGYDNQPFNFRRSLFCRETGRIFPNSIDWLGRASLDWDFLQKKRAGSWVSWGALPPDTQRKIRDKHESLELFETEFSCPKTLPKEITPEYVYHEKGPLYVDLDTHVLMGWQKVPYTEFEVLVVQHPKGRVNYE